MHLFEVLSQETASVFEWTTNQRLAVEEEEVESEDDNLHRDGTRVGILTKQQQTAINRTLLQVSANLSEYS